MRADSFGGGDQSFEPPGMRHGIVVQGRKVWCIGSAKRLVDGGPEADIAVIDDHAHADPFRFCSMCPAVIDDNHLKPIERLIFE